MIYKVSKLASLEPICFKGDMLSKNVFFCNRIWFYLRLSKVEKPMPESVYRQRLSAAGGPRPSMCFPHATSSRVPARMITLVRLFLKTTLGQSGFLCPKSQHFNRFGEKSLLDNTSGIRYLNPNWKRPDTIQSSYAPVARSANADEGRKVDGHDPGST